MSVTRGASPYLSSELRGHSALVYQASLVELGSRRRKKWRKRLYADTNIFFSLMADIHSSCQGPTLGVTTDYGEWARFAEGIYCSSVVSFTSLVCSLGNHAKHRNFLVRSSTGFNICSHMGESTRLAERSNFSPLVSLCWCALWVGWTKQSFLVRKLNRVELPEQNIAKIRKMQLDTFTGPEKAPARLDACWPNQTGSSSKKNPDGWTAHEATTRAPPTTLCHFDSTRKMGSIDPVGRMEQAA